MRNTFIVPILLLFLCNYANATLMNLDFELSEAPVVREGTDDTFYVGQKVNFSGQLVLNTEKIPVNEINGLYSVVSGSFFSGRIKIGDLVFDDFRNQSIAIYVDPDRYHDESEDPRLYELYFGFGIFDNDVQIGNFFVGSNGIFSGGYFPEEWWSSQPDPMVQFLENAHESAYFAFNSDKYGLVNTGLYSPIDIYQYAPVPEPSTALIMSIGILACLIKTKYLKIIYKTHNK